MSKDVDSHILEIYEIKKFIGSGAYGHVWKAVNKATLHECALKKIFDAFDNEIDAQRTYREISILHELDHPNIIKLQRVLRAKNNSDLYLVFEYMEADLNSTVGNNVLEEVHLRFVTYQILKALKYMQSAQLIHRDLKPTNILINCECEVKLCDFGLVRSLTHEEKEPMVLTEEVATRWYRSPEVLLGSKAYSKQTDTWSVGCIIAEILMGEPIFPGESTLNQLEKILEFTGIPSKQSIDSLGSQTAESLINQLNISRRSLKSYFAGGDSQMVNLARKMLEFNPQKRITIEEALQNPIFDEFKSVKDCSDVCNKFIVPELDDNARLTVNQYRRIIYRDIQRRYPMPRAFDISLERKKFTRSHHSFQRPREVSKENHSSFHKSKYEHSNSCLGNKENISRHRQTKGYQSPSSLGLQTHNRCLQKLPSKLTMQKALQKSALLKVRSRKTLIKGARKEPRRGNVVYRT